MPFEVDPASLAERKEFWAVFETCLDGLPARQGEAFGLRVIDQVHADEVCKLLGISSTNLWVMLHRARARLRSCLEARWFGGDREEP